MFLRISQGLFIFTALCSFANEVAYLLFPAASLALLGVQPDGYGLVITRYYGAYALGWGWLLWWARHATQAALVRAFLGSILVTLSISAVVGALGMRAGVFGPLGWILVVTDSILSLGSLLALWGMGNRFNLTDL